MHFRPVRKLSSVAATFLRRNHETNQLVLPTLEGSTRTIKLDVDQQITVGCIGPDNFLLVITGTQLNAAICSSTGSTLLIRSTGEELSYKQLGCKVQNKDTLLEQGTCANGPGTNIRIGWTLDTTFVPLYEQYHDKNLALNYYSTHTVYGRNTAADDKGNDRPYPFLQDNYYPGIKLSSILLKLLLIFFFSN